MKKSILSLAIATLALGFTACEDVPAPYTVNSGEGGSTPTSGTLLEETFSSIGSAIHFIHRFQRIMESVQYKLTAINIPCKLPMAT